MPKKIRWLKLELNPLLSKPDHPPLLMLKASLTNLLILRIRLSTPHLKHPQGTMQRSLKLNAAAERKRIPKPLMLLRTLSPLLIPNKPRAKRPQVKQNLPPLQNLKQIQQRRVSRNQMQLLLTRILRRQSEVGSQKLFSLLILRHPAMPRSLRKFLLSRLPRLTRLQRQLSPLLSQKIQSNRQKKQLKLRLKPKQKPSRYLKLLQRRLPQESLRLKLFKPL